MRSRCITLAAVVLAGSGTVGIWLSASETPQPSGNDAPVIRQLLDRVAKLEARVGQLEWRHPQMVMPHAQLPQSVPADWQRGEINGLTFYIVPLGSSQSGQRREVK